MNRLCLTFAALALLVAPVAAQDTPEAAKARQLLKKKVKDIEFKNTPLSSALDELKDTVEGLNFRIDPAGGATRNQTITFSLKEGTVEEVLDGMFKKNGLGYYVFSKKEGTGKEYNGYVIVKQGTERGYEKGKEPK